MSVFRFCSAAPAPGFGTTRRRWLAAAAGGLLAPALAHAASDADDAARSSHFPFGPVAPVRPMTAWPVVTHQGRKTDLLSLLRGRSTALQLMFTGCSATCPIQGALFAEAQRELATTLPRAQWLSLSIDPLSDSPAALEAWLRKFDAAPGWLAAAPRIQDVDRIVELLGSGGERRPASVDSHPGQVYLLDARGSLVYRTRSMPPPRDIVTLLRKVDAAA